MEFHAGDRVVYVAPYNSPCGPQYGMTGTVSNVSRRNFVEVWFDEEFTVITGWTNKGWLCAKCNIMLLEDEEPFISNIHLEEVL